MAMRTSQFTLGRMLQAVFWFAVAAALFGLALRHGAPASGSDMRGAFALGGWAATGIGLALLCGRALETCRRRCIASLVCGTLGIVLKGVSLHVATQSILAAAHGQSAAARDFATYSDSFGGPAFILALASVVLAVRAIRMGRGWPPRAALLYAAAALLFQLMVA